MFFAGLGLIVPGMAAGEVDFLAYGDLRGYLEPCGCDPATDMGGILRINSQLRRERMTRPEVPVVNLGNNLSEKSRDQLKNEYLLKAEAVNRPDAYLLNVLELRTGKALSGVKLPFVLSNAGKLKGIAFTTTRELPALTVYGYTYSTDLKDKVRRLTPEMLGTWKREISRQRDKQSLLLFSGPDDDLAKILAADIFTAVVSGNTRSFSAEPGKEESENENLLQRVAGRRGVFMVPVGGQGILRSGTLTRAEARPVSAYLQPEPAKSQTESGLFLSKPVRVTWLRKETEGGHALSDLYREYTGAVTAAFNRNSKERLAALASSPFAGEAACVSCHPDQHAAYKKMAHAQAMKTLIDRNKHQDSECVSCHVVGAEVTGGFVSVQDSPQLANVQCENCHGPRKEHTKNPAVKPNVALKGSALCVTCHNAQHSPRFNFAQYWEKIKH
jgi:hypothetical protein